MKQIDRIRSMSAEELAEWLVKFVKNNYDTGGCCNYCKVEASNGCMYRCYDGVKAWLESEVEE